MNQKYVRMCTNRSYYCGAGCMGARVCVRCLCVIETRSANALAHVFSTLGACKRERRRERGDGGEIVCVYVYSSVFVSLYAVAVRAAHMTFQCANDLFQLKIYFYSIIVLSRCRSCCSRTRFLLSIGPNVLTTAALFSAVFFYSPFFFIFIILLRSTKS